MPTALYASMNPDDFHVINQTGVRQVCFSPDEPYAACWDALLDPAGRVFVAAGTEGAIGEYVRLCEYQYEENRFIERFYGKDIFMAPERAITSSKFHFSLDVMEDGRIIGASHTTDKAPAHPAWMYKQYYHHLWEGYPGSSLIVYDPERCTVEHLGILTPRETIYGGVYSPKDRAYYCLGYMRGHLYRYSLETRRLTDLGKVSEWKTFRLHLGPDGNIYGASKSGFLFMFDVRAQRLVDLGYEIAGARRDLREGEVSLCKSMAGCVNVPGSSRFLFSVFSADELYAHDTATRRTEFLGRLMNADVYCRGVESHECAYGLQFDREGVLWYALTCYPRSEMNADLGSRRAASLMRWDVLNGGTPECLGVIGTPARANATVPVVMLDQERDRLYAVDSNHGEDGMSLLAIDLSVFRPKMRDPGPPCRDPFLVKNQPRYLAMSNSAMDAHRFVMENPADFEPADMLNVKLWRQCRPEESRVIGLVWESPDVLCGVCGEDDGTPIHAFRLSTEGEVLAFAPLKDVDPAHRDWLLDAMLPQPAASAPGVDLPFHIGRQYKAVPSAEVAWNGGRRLIGTLDGLMAVVDGDRVFALGPAAPNGPVHCLTSNADGTVCYGVAGDPEDLGMVFRYDDTQGLRQLGHIGCNRPGPTGTSSSNELSSIVLSPDGRRLAVGSRDRLGVVYIVTL